MRYAGRITDWNDDKAFGFVVPNGGGDRAFVHISAFERGSRRPVAGDLVSYLPKPDPQGRLQALQIRYAGQKADARRHARRFPRAAAGLGSLLVLLGIAAIGKIPILLTGAYFLLSGIAYAAYWLDKAAARRGAWRIPEAHLHLVDFLGGWPGALVAQQQFRHKTTKQSYQSFFWLTVVFNLAGAWWVVHSGGLATNLLPPG